MGRIAVKCATKRPGAEARRAAKGSETRSFIGSSGFMLKSPVRIADGDDAWTRVGSLAGLAGRATRAQAVRCASRMPSTWAARSFAE